MSERRGFRGYNGSRPVRGTSFPQRVQNLVIRDYAARKGLRYLLSATEYAMPGCYMILENVLGELASIEGIIAFSIFMLPARKERRLELYARVLQAGCELHGALEGLTIRSQDDIAPVEDTIDVVLSMERTPYGGWYEKDAGPSGPFADPRWASFTEALG